MDEIFINNETPIAYRINFLSNIYTLPLTRMMEGDEGLLWHEWVVLFCLAHPRSQPWSAKDIARATSRPKNTISRAVHKLTQLGYIVRNEHPSDARVQTLTLTPQGRALHDRLLPHLLKAEAQVYGTLTPEESATLAGILDKLVERAATNGEATA